MILLYTGAIALVMFLPKSSRESWRKMTFKEWLMVWLMFVAFIALEIWLETALRWPHIGDKIEFVTIAMLIIATFMTFVMPVLRWIWRFIRRVNHKDAETNLGDWTRDQEKNQAKRERNEIMEEVVTKNSDLETPLVIKQILFGCILSIALGLVSYAISVVVNYEEIAEYLFVSASGFLAINLFMAFLAYKLYKKATWARTTKIVLFGLFVLTYFLPGDAPNPEFLAYLGFAAVAVEGFVVYKLLTPEASVWFNSKTPTTA